MRAKHRNLLLLRAGLFAGLLVSPVMSPVRGLARAQELKDELDALEDVPADDLSGLPAKDKSAAKGAPKDAAPDAGTGTAATASKDPLDDLPVEGAEKNAKAKSAKTPSDDAIPDDTAPATKEKTADATVPPPEAPPAAAKETDELDQLDAKADTAPGAPAKSADAGLESELRSIEDDSKNPEPKTATATAPAPLDANPPAQALTGIEGEPKGKVTNLDFRQLQDRVRLTIKGDRVMDWSRDLRSKRKQIMLELKNMSISRSVLKRALDTGEFDGPVALVQAFDAKAGSLPVVKVLFQLRNFVDPTVMKSGNELIVDFPILSDMTLFKSRSASQVEIPETFMSLTSKMPAVGQKIDLRVKDADLQDVLNFISQAAGKNFVLAGGPGSGGKVTINVRRTPWDEVLRILLVNAKLGYQKVGNVYRIAPLTELRNEIDDAIASAQKAEDLTPLETRLFALSYAQASKVMTNVNDFKTKRGKVSFEDRTNTLVVTDVPETLEKIARYVKSIDRQTAQILIEGRIVEASRDFLRNISSKWSIGPITSGPVTGSNLNVGTADTSLSNQLNVTLGSLGGWGAISAILGAQETEEKIKTIASPRIVATDTKSADMKQGQSILVPIPAAANAPGGFQTVNANLELKVTPQVTSDGFILMDLLLTRDTVIQNGAPGSIDTRSAQTQVLVENGKTVVLGGIYITDTDITEKGMPFLRSLPILGTLFTNRYDRHDQSNELLMFISPKILNPEKAFLANIEKEPTKEDEDAPKAVSSAADESIPDDTF